MSKSATFIAMNTRTPSGQLYMRSHTIAGQPIKIQDLQYTMAIFFFFFLIKTRICGRKARLHDVVI